MGPRGLMDKASDSGSEDWEFKSLCGRCDVVFLSVFLFFKSFPESFSSLAMCLAPV